MQKTLKKILNPWHMGTHLALDGNFGVLTINFVNKIVGIPIKDEYWPPNIDNC